jgi:hypothetical protein
MTFRRGAGARTTDGALSLLNVGRRTMAYVTIEKDGEPWMLCHATNTSDVEQRLRFSKTRTPTATFTHRLSTADETSMCAYAFETQHGLVEDPFKFFTVLVSDLTH